MLNCDFSPKWCCNSSNSTFFFLWPEDLFSPRSQGQRMLSMPVWNVTSRVLSTPAVWKLLGLMSTETTLSGNAKDVVLIHFVYSLYHLKSFSSTWHCNPHLSCEKYFRSLLCVPFFNVPSWENRCVQHPWSTLTVLKVFSLCLCFVLWL